MARVRPSPAQEGPAPREAQTAEPEPTAGDEKAKVVAKIARWRDNKAAAVSLRFDDSHPSHILIAVPLLTKHEMVGTFLINPGNGTYREYKDKWETEAIQGGHEFGNHTMHHRGAKDDEEADREIGECSEYIWRLFPGKSKLLAFRSGGGTTWNIKRPMAEYMQKWRLVHEPNSRGVASPDAGPPYVVNMQMFRERVEQAITDCQWVTFYYHQIGVEKGLNISAQTFREQMNYLRSKRKEAWFGGIAQVHKYQEERRRAKIAVQEIEPFKIKIDIACETDPTLYAQPLTVWARLPQKWPLNDIQALDADGNPIPMRRRSDAWHEPMLSVPPTNGTYYIHVVDPLQGRTPPKLPEESERVVKDEATGLEATICKWFDGRRAALSLRFDDSHPTHILKAVPILREYGFKGTFIIIPAGASYQKHKTEWEACAKQGDQEFGNHTMHHHGAKNDDEVEYEIGECSRYIWSLFPNKSKLLTFCTGGGTTWTMTKPLRYWLDKYHLDPMAGALSLADVYGGRVKAFQDRLAIALEKGEWMRTVYHQVGDPSGLGISEENFRAIQEITKQHTGDLWVAGMAEIFKYQEERKASKLSIRSLGERRVEIALTCLTDKELYDQPLTLQLTLPTDWEAGRIKVTDAGGKEIPTRAAAVGGRPVVRFDAPAVGGRLIVTGG
ncbi:MAG: polysaccharide deacetylase family protein [Planctomycetota bacterium]